MMSIPREMRLMAPLIVLVILATGYLIPLLPPYALRHVLDSVATQQVAHFWLLALALAYAGKIGSGIVVNVIQQWFIDCVARDKVRAILASSWIIHAAHERIHQTVLSDIPKVARCSMLVVSIVGQMISLSTIGILISKFDYVVAVACYCPMLIVTGIFAYRQHTTSLEFEAAQIADEAANGAALSIIKRKSNAWNAMSNRLALEKLAAILEQRASAKRCYQLTRLFTTMLARLVLPLTSALTALVLLHAGKLDQVGSLAMVLAYLGSANMLCTGLLDNLLEVRSTQVSFSRLRAVDYDAGPPAEVLDLDLEYKFCFKNIEEFAAMTGVVRSRMDAALVAMDLSPTMLSRTNIDGTGLSNGENKRLYMAAAMSLSTAVLKVKGLRGYIDGTTYERLVENIGRYEQLTGKRVTLC
ncbi:hypothetical protein C6Q14_21980 [Burkholderia ambifaria]|nr:hypothetical protein C6Q14_21980 [Burkholderia ambifaria]